MNVKQLFAPLLAFALERFLSSRDNYRPRRGSSKRLRINTLISVLLDLRIEIEVRLDVPQKIKQIAPNVTVIMMTAYSSIETSIEVLIKKGASLLY